jgi:hypothetical protein
MKPIRFTDIVETRRRLEIRAINRQLKDKFGNKISEQNYEKLLRHYRAKLKKCSIETERNDLIIVCDHDKDSILIFQHFEAEIEQKIKVTEEMKKAGIKGEYIIQKYSEKNWFTIGKLMNCSPKILESFTFKRLPKVKLDRKIKKERKVA